MLHLLRVYGKSLESSQWPPVHRPLLAAEYSRRKKNVWYQGAALLIRRRGIKNSQAKIPGSLEYSGWRRIRTALAYDRKTPERICSGVVVDGEGFEPSKASPADLQSVPFGHSGIHPRMNLLYTKKKVFARYFFSFFDVLRARACLKNHSRNLHAHFAVYFARIQLP